MHAKINNECNTQNAHKQCKTQGCETKHAEHSIMQQWTQQPTITPNTANTSKQTQLKHARYQHEKRRSRKQQTARTQ